jgi:hypothetical protein
MSRTVTCTTTSISRATKAGCSSRKLTDGLAETENDAQMDEASNEGTAERLNLGCSHLTRFSNRKKANVLVVATARNANLYRRPRESRGTIGFW